MEKIDVVLVLLNSGTLKDALKKLNSDKVNLNMIVTDNVDDSDDSEVETDDKVSAVGENEIPQMTFSAVYKIENKYKDFIWLLSGVRNNLDALAKAKNFLMTLGVPEDNIFNLEICEQISETWLGNLRHVEEHGADFFATGNEYMRDGLNLKYIPCVKEDKTSTLGGVNLANANQDLRQSFLTAKHVFAHVEPGTIKFVLIGLMPYSFRYDNAKDFVNQNNLQYLFAVNSSEENPRVELLKTLLSDDVKNIFEATTAAQADLNFDSIKAKNDREFSADAIADWKETIRFFTNVAPDENFKILKDYIELCLDNGAKPVGVVYPFFAATRGAYSKKLLREFRTMIAQLAQDYDFACVDMFDLNSWTFDCFCDMTHLNSKGSQLATALLSLKLYQQNLLPLESFHDMNYEYFYQLSSIAPKDDYNALMESVFKLSAQKISRKDKIRVGFVIYEVAQWCGDELYHLFNNDERFETTIFLCLQVLKADNELVKQDFLRGLEQFKSHGLNVIPMNTWKAPIFPQDVLFFLTPYTSALTRAFRFKHLTPKTLITHITYSFIMSKSRNSFYDRNIFRMAWKVFFSSPIIIKLFAAKNKVGMPRGVFSGYPRMDIFFKPDSKFHFDWKMARPDAKKIIWAPHWSINAVTRQATFQWNYKFMYEFAKAHPEISWVVKPHQALFFSTVDNKIFPTVEAFKEYLQAWDDLPNARVYTGAYYQDVFATSDGMIHDSSSFIAEYQFVNKPMIFLTREKTTFNELAEKILAASYLVDGKDLDAIATTIQKVIVEGDDYKAAERNAVFDKYLNYPKVNGMLASEFIYKSIADEFKEESK